MCKSLNNEDIERKNKNDVMSKVPDYLKHEVMSAEKKKRIVIPDIITIMRLI